jgi:hypothetical protein
LPAFSGCTQLQSFFLPPSLEVIDTSDSYLSSHPPHFCPSDGCHFCLENDCLVRIADHKLILYLSDSPTFCADAGISIVSEGSFAGNGRLQSIVFDCNPRLKLLPAGTFRGCPHLRSITVPKSVLVIGEKCFEKCSELTTVTFEFPASIRMIDSEAFNACSSLTSFTVPSSVSTLGKSVFSHCGQLSSVTFEPPLHLTDIPGGLFANCDSLTSLNLPASVIKIVGSTSSVVVPSTVVWFSLRAPGEHYALFGSTIERCCPVDCSRDCGKCL